MVTEKATSGLVVGLCMYVIGQVNFAVLALFLFMLIDFITGIFGAISQKEPITKDKLILGAIKKLAIALLWLVGVIAQLVIYSEGSKVGITVQAPFIALTMTFYLLGSETVSIIKNLGEMGVKAPKWFNKLANRMIIEEENIKNVN